MKVLINVAIMYILAGTLLTYVAVVFYNAHIETSLHDWVHETLNLIGYIISVYVISNKGKLL